MTWIIGYIVLLFVFTYEATGNRSGDYIDAVMMQCNSTMAMYENQLEEYMTVDIKQPELHPVLRDKVYHCYYNITVPQNYSMEVTVMEMVTGRSRWNFETKSCGHKNYLRIYDGIAAWKPTEMCGHYARGSMKTTRIIAGSAAVVEFRVEKYTDSTAYDVRVRFKKKEVQHTKIGKKFGGYEDVAGQVTGKICDWEIDVTTCRGHCEVTTPGYPGIYPPHSKCIYKLRNPDGERVELYLNGQSTTGGKFDIKKTDDCAEDRVVVYDGDSVSDQVIGIFCGTYVPMIVSSGSALTIEFEAKAGGPRWDYTGFDARATSRWSDEFRTGTPILASPCSWMFNSSVANHGAFHTPDGKIYEKSKTCEYQFYAEKGKNIQITIKFYKLKGNREESIDIFYEGRLESIWSDHAIESRNTKEITSSSGPLIIRYILLDGQISNDKPVWIYYEFVDAPVTDNGCSSKQQTLMSILLLLIAHVIIFN